MTANGSELTSLMERRKEQEEQYMEARSRGDRGEI